MYLRNDICIILFFYSNHLLVRELDEILKNVADDSCAIALPISVLPIYSIFKRRVSV